MTGVVFGNEGGEASPVVTNPKILEAAYLENEIWDKEAEKAPLAGRLDKINQLLALQLEVDVQDFVNNPTNESWQDSLQRVGAIMDANGRADRAQYVVDQAGFAQSLKGNGLVFMEKSLKLQRVRVPMRRTNWSDMWAEGEEDYDEYSESIAPVYSEQDDEGNPLGIKWSVRFDGKSKLEVISSSDVTVTYHVEMKKKLDDTYEQIKLQLATQRFSDGLTAGRKEVVDDSKQFKVLSRVLEDALDNYLILDHGRENEDTKKYRELLAELESAYLRATLNDNMTWIFDHTQENVLEALARLSRGSSEKLDEFRQEVKEALKSKDLFKDSKETIMRIFAALPAYREDRATPRRTILDNVNDQAVADMGASFLGSKTRYKLALSSSEH
jgi:hypothetical protein